MFVQKVSSMTRHLDLVFSITCHSQNKYKRKIIIIFALCNGIFLCFHAIRSISEYSDIIAHNFVVIMLCHRELFVVQVRRVKES